MYVIDYAIDDEAVIIRYRHFASSIPATWGTSVKEAFLFAGYTHIKNCYQPKLIGSGKIENI